MTVADGLRPAGLDVRRHRARARSSGSRSATRSASTSRTRPSNQLSALDRLPRQPGRLERRDDARSTPGEEKVYEWTADYAGVWMYHCGTAPALHHIANGMYGMVIVEPKEGLPPVDNEFALVQSEWYLGPQGEPTEPDEGRGRRPGARLRRLQRRRQPVQGRTRSRSGPASGSGSSSSTPGRASTARSTSSARSSTRVIKEGVHLDARATPGSWGSQAVDLAPAQGGDRRVHDRRGRPVPDRHPRLQLRRTRRARPVPGRRRRPDELTAAARPGGRRPPGRWLLLGSAVRVKLHEVAR